MQRGINQQQILEDKEDNHKFLEILRECKSLSGFELYAYCLMGNHVHLVIKVGNEPLDTILKRICVRYANWYNTKYRRVGHLFQDRFKSEPIETAFSFLKVLRYVHQNPVKAGIVKTPGEYPYCSFNSYMNPTGNALVDIGPVLALVSIEEFAEFHGQVNEDTYVDITELTPRLTDEQAKRIVWKVSQCRSASEFQQLEIKVRNDCLRRLRAEGLSVRQISRLTGVSKGVIQRCTKCDDR